MNMKYKVYLILAGNEHTTQKEALEVFKVETVGFRYACDGFGKGYLF
mgnify:CR=1 FL=1